MSLIATIPNNYTDRNAVRYQACFCAENYILFLGKLTKTAATPELLFFDSNMHQTVCRWGFAPDHMGEFKVLLRPSLYLGGLLLKGGEGKVGEGKGRPTSFALGS